jgi:toxin ParE1/3/4
MPGRDIEFAPNAVLDLEEIRFYTQSRWGPEQTLEYLESIYEIIEHLRDFPYTGKDCSDLVKGLRSIRFGSHVIYYRVVPDLVRITNILHVREDAETELSDSGDDR